jgi:hypothetical protein
MRWSSTGSVDLVGKQRLVLLKTADGSKFLPIWIGRLRGGGEADQVAEEDGNHLPAPREGAGGASLSEASQELASEAPT